MPKLASVSTEEEVRLRLSLLDEGEQLSPDFIWPAVSSILYDDEHCQPGQRVLPVTKGEHTCAPVAIEIIDDQFIKRVQAISDSTCRSFLMPLFSHPAGRPRRSTPALRIDYDQLADKNLAIFSGTRQILHGPGFSQVAADDQFLREMAIPQFITNPYWAIKLKLAQLPHSKEPLVEVTCYVDSITLMEAMIACDETSFRLLIHPLRGVWVKAFETPGGVVLDLNSYFHKAAYTSFPYCMANVAFWLRSSVRTHFLDTLCSSLIAGQWDPLQSLPAQSTNIIAVGRGKEALITQIVLDTTDPPWNPPEGAIYVVSGSSNRFRRVIPKKAAYTARSTYLIHDISREAFLSEMREGFDRSRKILSRLN